MHSHFLKNSLKETLHFSACCLFLKKWKKENVVTVINITPAFVFYSTHRGLSCHKCKKIFYDHKILANFILSDPSPPLQWEVEQKQGTIKLLSYLVRSLLMKIITTVPKALFFKTTDLYTVYLFSEYPEN